MAVATQEAQEPLLLNAAPAEDAGEPAAPTASCRNCSKAAWATVALAVLLTVAVTHLPSIAGQLPRPSSAPTTAGFAAVHTANVSELTLQDFHVNSPSCWTSTGGTCHWLNCYAYRGPTNCIGGKCFCKANLCSSVEGRCSGEHNKLIASSFVLRNAQWPKYKLTAVAGCADSPRTLQVTDNEDNQHDRLSKFSLWELPGKVTLTRKGAFILRPDAFPSCVVTITGSRQPVVEPARGDPLDAALNLVDAPTPPNAIMIESVLDGGEYLSMDMHPPVATVAYAGHVQSSYWVAEPPIHLP